MDDRQTYEVILGYFKKGDDAQGCHNGALDNAAGFIAHAEMLEDDAKTLRRLAGLAREGRLSFVEADTHWIFVRCDAALGKQLVQEGALYRGENLEYGDEIRRLEEEEADDEAGSTPDDA